MATRNYELDSGAYFLNMLWNYFSMSPPIFGAERFLNETALFDAAMLLVDTWVVEQEHEARSPYRYSELPRGGLGPASAYTGMSWSSYRPSDDPQTHGYNIPVNMYAVGALERALVINERVWRSARFAAVAAKLAADIRAGIEAHGIVTHDDEFGKEAMSRRPSAGPSVFEYVAVIWCWSRYTMTLPTIAGQCPLESTNASSKSSKTKPGHWRAAMSTGLFIGSTSATLEVHASFAL